MKRSYGFLPVVLLSLCSGAANELTDSEKQAGFELLLNGKDLT
jgi:hypothetical protein